MKIRREGKGDCSTTVNIKRRYNGSSNSSSGSIEVLTRSIKVLDTQQSLHRRNNQSRHSSSGDSTCPPPTQPIPPGFNPFAHLYDERVFRHEWVAAEGLRCSGRHVPPHEGLFQPSQTRRLFPGVGVAALLKTTFRLMKRNETKRK